jgi:hypothetical protein
MTPPHSPPRKQGPVPDSPPSEDALAEDIEEPGTAAALAAQDRSGWPPHPSERRDFYYRIRAFPPGVATWARQMVSHITEDL